jgi:hypothetical protein
LIVERRSPQELFESALRDSNQTMCPVSWVRSLIDALRAAVDPTTAAAIDTGPDGRDLQRRIHQILKRHIPTGNGEPWCMSLRDYCDALGIKGKKHETYRKRAERHSLPGAFKSGRRWFVCGFSPLARA